MTRQINNKKLYKVTFNSPYIDESELPEILVIANNKDDAEDIATYLLSETGISSEDFFAIARRIRIGSKKLKEIIKKGEFEGRRVFEG